MHVVIYILCWALSKIRWQTFSLHTQTHTHTHPNSIVLHHRRHRRCHHRRYHHLYHWGCRYYKASNFAIFVLHQVHNGIKCCCVVHKIHPIWEIFSKEDLTTQFSALHSLCWCFVVQHAYFNPLENEHGSIMNYYHWTLECVTDFYRCYYHSTTNFDARFGFANSSYDEWTLLKRGDPWEWRETEFIYVEDKFCCFMMQFQ